MDLEVFKKYANRFGFGVESPTDLLEQTAGVIPDSAYFERTGRYWGTGTIMNLGVGQGDYGSYSISIGPVCSCAGQRGHAVRAPYGFSPS